MAQFVGKFAEPGDPEYAPPKPVAETPVMFCSIGLITCDQCDCVVHNFVISCGCCTCRVSGGFYAMIFYLYFFITGVVQATSPVFEALLFCEIL